MFRLTSLNLSKGRLIKEMCSVQVHCDKNQDSGVPTLIIQLSTMLQIFEGKTKFIFKVKVKIMLRPTVSRPVCLGTKHPFEAYDQILIIVWLVGIYFQLIAATIYLEKALVYLSLFGAVQKLPRCMALHHAELSYLRLFLQPILVWSNQGGRDRREIWGGGGGGWEKHDKLREYLDRPLGRTNLNMNLKEVGSQDVNYIL
jgi:hypothetical protein